MTDTKEILLKIAALRVRLDQAENRLEAGIHAKGDESEAELANALAEKVSAGIRQNALLDSGLRPLEATAEAGYPLPSRLTARGAAVLERGRELLGQLRELLEDPALQTGNDDPLTLLHVETAAILDVVLRTVQAFPPSAGAQIRMCAGLEAAQRLVEERLAVLHTALTQRRRETGRVDLLAGIFARLAAEDNVDPRPILIMAEEIVREAQAREPLRFLAAGGEKPAHFAAAHGITVAQVMGRILLGDSDWQNRLPEALFAALVHDAGMARVSPEILAKPGPLSDDEHRAVERHTHSGVQMISRIMPGGGIFVEGAADHHERLDGTGYPAGRRDHQLPSFGRLLAVCDVYAAMASRRPHRPAHDTRSALTDTLLMAERGKLDRTHAEKLLTLSFYPAGSVVELSDGSAGYVVAAVGDTQKLDQPGKPAVVLLSGPGGQASPWPRVVHLAQDSRSIIRSLPPGQRRKLLLGRYPELI